MNFSGAALGGLTPNVTSVFFLINKSISAGLSPVSILFPPIDYSIMCLIYVRFQASILGLSNQFPEDMDFLISRLKTDGPFNSTGFLAARNYTLDEALVAYAFQDISEYFVGGVADIEGTIPTQAINRDGIMGYHGVPQMPVFAYKAIGDEISAINDTDALVDKYCNSEL